MGLFLLDFGFVSFYLCTESKDRAKYAYDPENKRNRDTKLVLVVIFQNNRDYLTTRFTFEHLKKYAELFGIKLSSLILLSESYEEAEKEGKGSALIRAMMINHGTAIIDHMKNSLICFSKSS